MKARSLGIKAGLFRPITLWPFPYTRLSKLSERAKSLLVVEMNCGQMLEDVRLATGNKAPVHFIGFAGGRVPTESDIFDNLSTISKKQE